MVGVRPVATSTRSTSTVVPSDRVSRHRPGRRRGAARSSPTPSRTSTPSARSTSASAPAMLGSSRPSSCSPSSTSTTRVPKRACTCDSSQPDGAAAEDEQRRRALLRRQGLVARPRRHPVEPVDRRDDRLRAGGDHEVGPAELAAVDRDDAGRRHAAVPAHEHHARLGELAGGAVVLAVLGDLVATGDGGAEGLVVAVERRRRRRPGQLGEPAGLVARLGAAQHRLARHAGDVRALTADAQLLHEGDRAALLGQRGGDALAGRAGTEHDDVEGLHARKRRPSEPGAHLGDEVSTARAWPRGS